MQNLTLQYSNSNRERDNSLSFKGKHKWKRFVLLADVIRMGWEAATDGSSGLDQLHRNGSSGTKDTVLTYPADSDTVSWII